MCGIAGIVQCASGPSTAAIVERMTAALAHRGPDDAGFYEASGRGVALGHRRLSILDLSPHGRQPMTNEDGTVHVVFNGEIYNFRGLTRTLQAAGHRFRSRTDTEVIVHAYEEWGTACVERFHGMFAFAIWDARSDTLLLARDRIGIKPLYYLEGPWGIAFASEAKAFLALPKAWWQPHVDEASLHQYLAHQCLLDHGRTMLAGVAKLPPGHVMVIRHGVSRLTRYWALERDSEIAQRSFDEATDALRALLSDVVREHLVADVPVGILLSGGVDSSVITALAAAQVREVRTFTVGFAHAWDERAAAQGVADYIGTAHTALEVPLDTAWDTVAKTAASFDDLSSADPGLLTTRLMAAEARARGIKVLLVGEGADEIFGGYPWFGLSQLPFRWLPASWWRRAYAYGVTRQGLRYRPRWDNTWRIDGSRSRQAIFDRVSYAEITRQLPNHLLMKVDKSTMAMGVEARVPYLDHRVVEFAYSLPCSYKLPGRWFRHGQPREKRILRAVGARDLPLKTIARKKRGFMFPVGEFLTVHAERIRDLVRSPRTPAFGLDGITPQMLLTPQRWQPLEWERHMLLWKVVILELWARTLTPVTVTAGT